MVLFQFHTIQPWLNSKALLFPKCFHYDSEPCKYFEMVNLQLCEAPVLQSELFLQDAMELMEAIVLTYPVSSITLKPLCSLWLSFSNGLSNQDSLSSKEQDEWAPQYLTRARTHHVGSPFNNYLVGLRAVLFYWPSIYGCLCLSFHLPRHLSVAIPSNKERKIRLLLYLYRDPNHPMDDETKKRRWAGSVLDSDEPHLLATNKLSQASHVWHYMTCTHYILHCRELIWDWN